MNVVKIESRTVKTYTLTIEDGEVRPKQYSRVGARYQVMRVEVVKRDGNVSSATLNGAVLKKDGTLRLVGVTERLYGQHDWPQWLHTLVKGLA